MPEFWRAALKSWQRTVSNGQRVLSNEFGTVWTRQGWLPDAARSVHMQVDSVPKRNHPDSGEVNYPYLFRVIDEIGYDGWVGCEYRPAGKTTDGLAWLPAASGSSK